MLIVRYLLFYVYILALSVHMFLPVGWIFTVASELLVQLF